MFTPFGIVQVAGVSVTIEPLSEKLARGSAVGSLGLALAAGVIPVSKTSAPAEIKDARSALNLCFITTPPTFGKPFHAIFGLDYRRRFFDRK
jgi:hypothetical protein